MKRGCVVLDASALQGDEPGPRSPCHGENVFAWMGLLAAVEEKCWSLHIPVECMDEIKKRFGELKAAPLLSKVFARLQREGKLYVHHVGAQGDDAYLVLALRLARQCSRLLLVTCDRELMDKARSALKGHTTAWSLTPEKAHQAVMQDP